MSPDKWDDLINRARLYSINHQERVRVRGCQLGPRAARYLKVNWIYVIDCVTTCPCRSK